MHAVMVSPWGQWLGKVLLSALLCVGTSVYTRLLVLPMTAGRPRIVAALPALAFYWFLPFLFDDHTEMLTRASVGAMFLWLASFKVRPYGYDAMKCMSHYCMGNRPE